MWKVTQANPIPVIAIDGPSSSGKGTVAAALAEKLGFHYLDSGALYRLTALSVLKAGVNPDEEAACEAVARAMSNQPRNSGGMQSSRPLVVNLILDGQRFARATVPYINAETTRAGVNIVKK